MIEHENRNLAEAVKRQYAIERQPWERPRLWRLDIADAEAKGPTPPTDGISLS